MYFPAYSKWQNICWGEKIKMTCKHDNGWFFCEDEPLIINENQENDDIIAEFMCNTIGCSTKKKFKFDIINVEEVK